MSSLNKSFPVETLYAYPLNFSDQSGGASRKVLQSFEQLKASSTEWLYGRRALYVHIPYCLTLCQFCGFVKDKASSKDELESYVKLLINEIRFIAIQLPMPHRRLSSIYFGGGSPSVLKTGQVSRILDQIHKSFDTSGVTELSFEGEANTLWQPGYVESLAHLGFNRLSYGVQTMDQGARDVLNLKPSINNLRLVYEKAFPLFDEVMVDFMFGWPGQDIKGVTKDITCLLDEIQPCSIEAFLFEPLDASPDFITLLSNLGANVPGIDTAISLRQAVVEILNAYGFSSSSYTKYRKKANLRAPSIEINATYDQSYYGWSNGQVIGVGRGAQSFLAGVMWGAAVSAKEYADAINQERLPVSTVETYELDERERVTWPRRGCLPKRLIIPGTAYSEKIETLIAEGLATTDCDFVTLTSVGEQLVPAIMHALLPPRQRCIIDKISEERLIGRRAA